MLGIFMYLLGNREKDQPIGPISNEGTEHAQAQWPRNSEVYEEIKGVKTPSTFEAVS